MTIKVNNNRDGLGFLPPRTAARGYPPRQRLRATETASRWSALQQRRESNIKTKTFYERKTKTKLSPPEARSSLPLVGPATVAHKSRFNQTGQPYLCKTAALPGRFLVDPDWPDFRSLRSRARQRRQGNEMMLTKHRIPHGRSPPLGQLHLTHVDQSVNI